MRILEKWLKSTSKKKIIIKSIFVLYLIGILWVTLFNRSFSYSHQFLQPFWSYKRIAEGSVHVAKENIENIMLFIPFGYFLKLLWRTNLKKTVMCSFMVSLSLEVIQFVLTLGFFEIDDLLHNTLGALLGFYIYKILPLSEIRNGGIRLKKGLVKISLLLTMPLLFWGYLYQMNYSKMVRYASLNDNEYHNNILILEGEDSFVGNSSVYVEYLSDGRIHIFGNSDKREWLMIGNVKLNQGTYTFSGMDKVVPETVAIELEYYNSETHDYVRLTPDIGPVEKVTFTLDKTTKIRAYVTVYEDVECDVFARPVIYKLGE